EALKRAEGMFKLPHLLRRHAACRNGVRLARQHSDSIAEFGERPPIIARCSVDHERVQPCADGKPGTARGVAGGFAQLGMNSFDAPRHVSHARSAVSEL